MLTDPQFRVARRLGAGTSAEVFEVELGDQRAALKVGRESSRAALAWEAERLLLCDSAHLPRALDVGVVPNVLSGPDGAVIERGSPYLLTTFAVGRDLNALGDDADPEALARAVGRDVAEALGDLHCSGFAHGDVKPANVIADVDDPKHVRCTLIDLGLAEATDTQLPSGGTPRYLAPEVASNEAISDGRARDLWALGLTLLEILVPEARRSPAPIKLIGNAPEPFRSVVGALLSEHPGARPGAEWVRRQLGAGAFDPVRAAAGIKRSYLMQRASSLRKVARGYQAVVDVDGIAGEWLRGAATVLTRITKLRNIQASGTTERFGSLREAEQRTWLLSLVGSAIVDFPPLPSMSDGQLVGRLLALAQHGPPESFTYGSVRDGIVTPHGEHPQSSADWALALGAEAPTEQTLQACERLVFEGSASDAMTLALGAALKRRNAIPRALAVLRQNASTDARLEEAHALVRLGDTDGAQRLLHAAERASLGDESRGMLLALRSRLALMQGDTASAWHILQGAPTTAKVLEARAAVQLTRGELDAAQTTLLDAQSYARTAEERSRVEAMLANRAQQAGEAEAALAGFRKAAEHATRCGALLEEATYLVGVASTATNAGRLAEALGAAERSALLFEHLGKPEAAARALLSRASAFAGAGASREAEEAAQATITLSRRAKDRRCQAFAHFVLCEVLDPDAAKEHVQRAEALLGELRGDDALRVAARKLRFDVPVDIGAMDELARREASVDARLDWWGTRARVALRNRGSQRPDVILLELHALAQAEVGVSARGPAFAYGTQLAAESGDGDAARRFGQLAGDALSKLRNGIAAEHRLAFGQLEWTKLLSPRTETHVAPEQLADIETLIRGLSDRQSLGLLLNRILDALVLWTSVERGLLLLTAPGGKLVPRAARNLARSDLSGDQRKLSYSLAYRALQSKECIVAVDAAGELPEVHASVHSLKLRSVLAVPLLSRGEVVGVAYLDDRVRRGAFGKQELAWVSLVSTLAAASIAEARDQLMLRRAARRAQRAEDRITGLLVKREAQLELVTRELARSKERGTRYTYDDVVGNSEAVRRMLALVDRVTPSDVPVLVTGESGSGKELVARAIHFNGPRRDAAFVSENCSAIPETLLESTLFGHVKGAFTGAARHHAGLFEVADGGTLFLDEVADMSLAMQTKLLRAVENGEIRRVGSERTLAVDVRVIAATHKNLERLVATGKFREDLYYRLNVICVPVPALRERIDDIPLLVRHFLRKYAPGQARQLSAEAQEKLCTFHWPGNVRQLENEVRRALVLADGEIQLDHLSPVLTGGAVPTKTDGLNLKARLDAVETDMVRRALKASGGNQTHAAKLLGVSRFGLQKMIKRLEIDIGEAVLPDA